MDCGLVDYGTWIKDRWWKNGDEYRSGNGGGFSAKIAAVLTCASKVSLQRLKGGNISKDVMFLMRKGVKSMKREYSMTAQIWTLPVHSLLPFTMLPLVYNRLLENFEDS
jgi:hypothetical protein